MLNNIISPKPFRALYSLGVTITFLVLMAVLCFAFYAVISSISSAIGSSMNQYDLPNTSYQAYELANTFMLNLAEYLLALTVFGLFAWILVYSQRKKVGYQ